MQIVTIKNADTLTEISDILYLLQQSEEKKMGTIRTKGKCPVCQESFKLIKKLGYICPDCKITPLRFYIDLSHKGQRIRIFSDKQGQPLDTYQRAVNLLSHINYELKNHSFDPTKYIKAELEKFYISNLFEIWKSTKGDCSPHYARQLRFVSSYIFSYFKAATDIRELRTYDIENFYSSLKGISAKSKYNIMGVLKSFINYLHRLEYIQVKPIFPKISFQEPQWKWLSIDQQALIFSNIPENDKPIFLFMALHGCRPGEARAIKVSDIDLKQQSVKIQRVFSTNVLRNTTKNKKNRIIPVHPDFLSILLKSSRDKLPEAFLFTNPRTGNPYSDTTLKEIWYKAIKKTDIKITMYEGLRHSFASQRASAGMPLYLISKVLGHSDIRVTQRYAHTSLDALRIVVENKPAEDKTVTRLSPRAKLH